MKRSQNERFDARERTLWSSGVFGRTDEADGGVGGVAGTKNDGMAATEDYSGVR